MKRIANDWFTNDDVYIPPTPVSQAEDASVPPTSFSTGSSSNSQPNIPSTSTLEAGTPSFPDTSTSPSDQPTVYGPVTSKTHFNGVYALDSDSKIKRLRKAMLVVFCTVRFGGPKEEYELKRQADLHKLILDQVSLRTEFVLHLTLMISYRKSA